MIIQIIEILCDDDVKDSNQNNGITNPNDAEALDNPAAPGTSSKNIENNSNNIDIISNSYNNISNNLATATPHSNTNTPPYPLDALLPLLRYQITP